MNTTTNTTTNITTNTTMNTTTNTTMNTTMNIEDDNYDVVEEQLDYLLALNDEELDLDWV